MAKTLSKRILGIDYGLSRIGLALSDSNQIIAMPLETLKTEKKLESTVINLLKKMSEHEIQNGYELEEIVVGMPLLMSGKSGLIADEVNVFIDLLKQHTTIPIFTWDERLTSVQAERSLRESKLSRKRRTEYIDQVSAVIILQNYLDSKKREQ